MDNPQYYQPLSAALHAPLLQQSGRPPHPSQYANYSSHAPPPQQSSSANTHREEEEEEEEDDDDVVEEELDHHDPHHSASAHSSPRTQATSHNQKYSGSAGTPGTTNSQYNSQPQNSDHPNASDEKRKPGRPRGSRNRKPRAPPSTPSSKAPANTPHPGFYQYPPAPGTLSGIAQNQQFYEFQWRALNLCSEFYNAAEELIKAANPMVIAQCYQMGPSQKIDPLAMITDAKRVCDTLLANPTQLVGSPPPSIYPTASPYPPMPPPPAPGTSAAVSSAPPGPVITNPQTFVMPLGPPSMSGPAPASYYPPPMYTTPPGTRYPTTPYYSYPPQPPAPYYPPQPQPPPQTAPPPPQPAAPTPTAPPAAPAPPPPAPPTAAPASSTGTLSTFNAATGNVAPGGQQGTWSEEETERLRKLAEQSKETGGAQGKGEIDWDWVVHQWGNTRTRHQILLKATSMGLKESTTRGTKRRRDNESSDTGHSNAHPPPSNNLAVPSSAPPPPVQAAQTHSPASTSTPTSVAQSASPHLASRPPPPQSQQHQSQQPTTINPARTTNAPPPSAPQTTPTAPNLPWPMPTVAANTPSPVIAHSQIDVQQQPRSGYYRTRAGPQTSPYGAPLPPPQQSSGRPTSSQGNTHQFMYRPNGTTGRRENGA